uniref:Uncharacterized protein n=1 Tax=Anguilla anguilla TaxID=7936 RepID=A0A0E9WKE9_ANGAN
MGFQLDVIGYQWEFMGHYENPVYTHGAIMRHHRVPITTHEICHEYNFCNTNLQRIQLYDCVLNI